MKTIGELGISKWPWTFVQHLREGQFVVRNFLGKIIVGYSKKSNARLIAAAPELYEALREAVLVKCTDCGASDINCAKCAVDRWRSVLAKAAGEEVANV